MNKGKLIPAIIDPNETYFVSVKTIKKIPRLDNAAGGWTAKTIPNNVAIPFPPLNPANKGNICPRTAQKPKASFRFVYGAMSWIAYFDWIKTRLTAIAPLRTSNIKTGIPAFLPRTRNVFVAPAFPEPCSRTSMPWKIFPTQTAEGTEPMR